MTEASHSSQLIRFGVFELDLRAGELRKKGVRVKLQEQPFQILVMLLEHPGQVVTREELHQKLWPEGTFVDFEHGLNAAVNRLRDALEDSPENSRFVETLPRRGYRFIAPVEGVSRVTPAAGAAGLDEGRLGRRAWLAALGLLALMVVLVGLNVGGLRDRLLGGPAPGEITSIAVLPLANLSGDPEQEYFVDGMTEALITELSKISALRVISRQSVMQFKGTNKSLPEIAQQLNVDAVVEGSAVHVGPAVGGTSDRVRISAQLIQAVPERHLWAESYERDLRDVLALQSEIAQAIAREVKATLTPEEETRLVSTRPVNPEAHEHYLKGRYHWNKRTREGLEQGLNYFQQAVEKDPGFAQAYVGIADSYLFFPGWGLLSPQEAYRKARTAALQALEIDDTLAEAHTTLASIKQDEWDWLGAEREYKRALVLNPNYATTHHWYSIFLEQIGKHDQAVAEAKRARELDPTSLIINSSLGARYFYARRFEEAIEQYRKTLELDPDFWLAHYGLGYVYLQKGLPQEAIPELQKAKQLLGSDTEAVLAPLFVLAYVLSGQRDRALKILDVVEQPEQTFVTPSEVATVYAILGDNDRAFQWLEKAYNDHDSNLVSAKVEFGLDPLRSDPRFQDLLRRMNFPD